MFRTARRIAPLLRVLLTGVAATTCVAAAGTAIVGCADENDPETWVKRLGDQTQKTAAVQRLIQFFDDAMTKDNKDRNGPNVKPLLETIIPPLTETCVGGDLDPRTNTALVKFLSDARDPRGEACIIKALKDYKPDSTEEDLRAAARAVRFMNLKSAAGPLLDAFKKVHHSKAKAAAMDLDVAEAMFAIPDPSWEGDLITMLGRPVDPKDQNQLADEMYWQATSARVLGILKAPNAVKPLIKMLLSPLKAAGQLNALLALVKIGKPSVGPAAALLKGDDKDLVEYSKTEVAKASGGDKSAAKGAETAHIGVAAKILATIGREESAGPLVDSLNNSKLDDVSRALIAHELYQVPKSPNVVKAFQDSYEKLGTGVSIPGANAGGKDYLLDSAGYYYDPTFVPWILKTTAALKGEESDVAPIRDMALQTVLKIMTADQIKDVEGLVNLKTTDEEHHTTTVGKAFEKEWGIAKETATACGNKLDCWAGKLTDPASQGEDKQFAGIKAAYMIGEIGGEPARKVLVDALPKLSNGAVRIAAVQAIDYLSPKGDMALAEQLQKMVDDANEKKDEVKMRAYAMFLPLIYRLHARAG